MLPLALRACLAAPFCIATALAAQQASTLGPRLQRPIVPATSELVHVPGDFPTVQAAIDAAAPGDRIVVHGGTHGSITIDRPLTLIGDPMPTFENGGALADNTWLAPIRLAGSGSGRVVLCQLRVESFVNGFQAGSSEAGIDGGGFGELHLYDCDVSGAFWFFLTGVAEGAPGIDVDVDALLVSGSMVLGSNSTNDGCYGGGPPGPPGVRAPGATTIVLDSTVQGGGSEPVCGLGECPPAGTAAGGAGVKTATLLRAASTITGGTGGAFSYLDEHGLPVPCGQGPVGPATVVASEVELPAGLAAVGPPPRAGGTWTLAWEPAAAAILLVARERVLAPLPLVFLGWYFLEEAPGPHWLLGLPGSGRQTLFFPASDELVGLTLTAQLLDLATGLSRPVAGCVRP